MRRTLACSIFNIIGHQRWCRTSDNTSTCDCGFDATRVKAWPHVPVAAFIWWGAWPHQKAHTRAPSLCEERGCVATWGCGPLSLCKKRALRRTRVMSWCAATCTGKKFMSAQTKRRTWRGLFCCEKRRKERKQSTPVTQRNGHARVAQSWYGATLLKEIVASFD